ncbi:MAG: DNA mismatch repair endonuclease MutL [Clostridia bacterium]|nr:DNA mismatch repair endonuclease MutL [Clostridia bacterium]
MGKVNVLDKHVAELIAAGEVIERPASVIKELVENSIDAGASAITVEIKNGGITFIRVADSGEGILREDIRNAFLRHATSKILTPEDLEGINTLGFRGEALASICAVSRVEVLTAVSGQPTGTRYIIEGGEETLLAEAGCPVGTTIIVRDLFYNTPARMKFLKKDVSEANAVSALIDRIALSHPEISFRFIRDSRETLHTPGNGDLKACIHAVYGKEFAASLIPVGYDLNGIKLSGFTCRAEYARASRSMQHFFINSRYVKSRTMQAALEEACKGFVMTGKFPACVLFLEIASNMVDVNVHPSKTEVRFVSERQVFDAVYNGIKTAMLSNTQHPEFRLAEKRAAMQEAARPVIPQEIKQQPVQQKFERFEQKPQPAQIINNDRTQQASEFTAAYNAPPRPAAVFNPVNIDIAVEDFDEKPVKEPEEVKEETPAMLLEQKPEEPKYHGPQTDEYDVEMLKGMIKGELFDTYIMLEDGDEVLIIDKHAAHERLIFERLKEGALSSAQYLFAPVTVTLEKGEYDAVISNLDLLDEAGYEIEDFGDGTVIVRAFPSILEEGDIIPSVCEIASGLLKGKMDAGTEKIDWIFHNVACRSAIKGGDKSSAAELAALVLELKSKPWLRNCPHGRPIYYSLKRREIEKQFGRV